MSLLPPKGGAFVIPTGQGLPGQGPEPEAVAQPGGDLLNAILHPSVPTYERLFRVQPDETWYSANVSPTRPISVQLGAFIVPKSQHIWISDYLFRVYRFSGLDAGDVVPAEEGRFSNIMGFDITTSLRRQSNIQYQLDPIPAPTQVQMFDPSPNQLQRRDQFTRQDFASFAVTSSQGTALLPVRARRQGSPAYPFLMLGQENDRFTLTAVIFRPLTTPIAFIEGSASGVQLPANQSTEFLNRRRPR